MKTRTPLSKSAAKAQAHRESHMYRQGNGYIVSTWDDGYGCSVVSHEMPHSNARTALADWRVRRTRVLQGLEEF